MASLPLSEFFPFSRDFNMATDCRPLFRDLKTVLQNGCHTLFFLGFQHGCHSPFGGLIWPPSPFSDFQNDCHPPVRDVPTIGFLGIFTMATIPFFGGFKNNCHPSFLNFSMAAMSLFGIPIWLPSTILVFAHGYISLFRDLKIVTTPFFGIRRKRKMLTRLTPWETHTIRIHCPPVGLR